MKLKDIHCKSAEPHEKNYKMYDGGGLYLEVTPRGSKLWRLKYRYLNKEKKLCIGPYPIITLAEARSHREEAKKLLANDIDPSALKQQKKQNKIEDASNTFETIAREWFEMKKVEWSEANSVQTITGCIEMVKLSPSLSMGR